MRPYDLIISLDSYDEKDRLRHEKLLRLNINKNKYSNINYYLKCFLTYWLYTSLPFYYRLPFSIKGARTWFNIPRLELEPSKGWTHQEKQDYYKGKESASKALELQVYSVVNSDAFNIGFVERVFSEDL